VGKSPISLVNLSDSCRSVHGHYHPKKYIKSPSFLHSVLGEWKKKHHDQDKNKELKKKYYVGVAIEIY